jgi:hypothetical protein
MSEDFLAETKGNKKRIGIERSRYKGTTKMSWPKKTLFRMIETKIRVGWKQQNMVPSGYLT